MPSEQKSQTPDWLQKIQNESWEAEILISGGAVYALLELSDYLIIGNSLQSIIEFGNPLYALGVSITLLNAPIKLLTLGFIIHLIIRGLWAGMIGLSFSFPNGIKKETLNWKGKFSSQSKNLRDNSYIVLGLERISGIVFSYSVFIFLVTIGLVSWLLFIFSLTIFIPNSSTSILDSFVTLLYLIGSLIYFIDFISLGRVKKNKSMSKLFYPIHKFYSIILLSVLYRNIYYTFISNWGYKYFYISLLIPIAFLSSTLLITDTSIMQSQFLNEKSENSYNISKVGSPDNAIENPGYIIIGNDLITDGVLPIYLVHYVQYEDSIKNLAIKEGLILNSTHNFDSLDYKTQMKCMELFYKLSIDSKPVDVKWDMKIAYYKKIFPYYLLTSWIDVSDLSNEKHQLELNLNYSEVFLVPENNVNFFVKN